MDGGERAVERVVRRALKEEETTALVICQNHEFVPFQVFKVGGKGSLVEGLQQERVEQILGSLRRQR